MSVRGIRGLIRSWRGAKRSERSSNSKCVSLSDRRANEPARASEINMNADDNVSPFVAGCFADCLPLYI